MWEEISTIQSFFWQELSRRALYLAGYLSEHNGWVKVLDALKKLGCGTSITGNVSQNSFLRKTSTGCSGALKLTRGSFTSRASRNRDGNQTDSTMPNRTRIASQTLWSFLPTAVSAFTAIFSIPFFLQYLGPHNYAIMFYVTSISGIFSFIDLGIAVSVGRYLGQSLGENNPVATREYWGTGQIMLLAVVFAFSCTFGLLGVIFGPMWFTGAEDSATTLRICYIIGAGSMFASFYLQLWVILAQCHLEFAFIGITRALAGLIAATVAIIAAWWTHNAVWVMASGLMVSWIQIIIYAFYSKNRFGLLFNFSDFRWGRVYEMKAYTGKIVLNMLFSFLGGLDKIVAGRLVGAKEFTFYNISTNAGSRIFSLGQAIMSPVFHNTTRAMATNGLAGAAVVYEEAVQFMFRFMLHGAIVLGVWQLTLLQLWLGPTKAMEISPVFYPLVLSCIAAAFSLVSSAQLPAFDRVNTMTAFQFAQSLSAGLGVLVGWQLMGFPGIAYGVLASRLINLAQDFWTARYLKTAGIWSFWGLSEVIKQSTVGLLIGLWLHYFPPSSIVWTLALFVLHLAYLPALYVSRKAGQI
jgi:O-antigen/teichoic acid export membrane protein